MSEFPGWQKLMYADEIAECLRGTSSFTRFVYPPLEHWIRASVSSLARLRLPVFAFGPLKLRRDRPPRQVHGNDERGGFNERNPLRTMDSGPGPRTPDFRHSLRFASRILNFRHLAKPP
jgi:hypothetical protein